MRRGGKGRKTAVWILLLLVLTAAALSGCGERGAERSESGSLSPSGTAALTGPGASGDSAASNEPGGTGASDGSTDRGREAGAPGMTGGAGSSDASGTAARDGGADAFRRIDPARDLVYDRAPEASGQSGSGAATGELSIRLPYLNIDHPEAEAFNERIAAYPEHAAARLEELRRGSGGAAGAAVRAQRAEIDYRFRRDGDRGIGGLVVASRYLDAGGRVIASEIETLSLDLARGEFLTGRVLNDRFGYDTLIDRMESAFFHLAGLHYADLEIDEGIALFAASLVRFWDRCGDPAADLAVVYTEPAGKDEAPWERHGGPYSIGPDGTRVIHGHTHDDNPLASHGAPRRLTAALDFFVRGGCRIAETLTPDDFYAHTPHFNPDYWYFTELLGIDPEDGPLAFTACLGRTGAGGAPGGFTEVERSLANFIEYSGAPPNDLFVLDLRRAYGLEPAGADVPATVHLIVPKYFETVARLVPSSAGLGGEPDMTGSAPSPEAKNAADPLREVPQPAGLGTVLVVAPLREGDPEEPAALLALRYRSEGAHYAVHDASGGGSAAPEHEQQILDVSEELRHERTEPVPAELRELLERLR